MRKPEGPDYIQPVIIPFDYLFIHQGINFGFRWSIVSGEKWPEATAFSQGGQFTPAYASPVKLYHPKLVFFT
jgi:hypothetical protein